MLFNDIYGADSLPLTLYTRSFLPKDWLFRQKKQSGTQGHAPPLALAFRGAGLVGRTLDEEQAGRCC